MAVVPVKINGRDYQIACDDGQEEHLRFLADEVDDRVRALAFRMGGNPGEAFALVLAALTMADEAIDNKKEIDSISQEIKRLTRQLNEQKQQGADEAQESRMAEMEAAMAATLEEIAARIEKIAERIEMR